MLEQLGEAAAMFWRIDTSRFNAVRIGKSLVLRSWAGLKMPCPNESHAIEGGSRLQEGRTEVMPSMAARGDRKLEANGCRGAS